MPTRDEQVEYVESALRQRFFALVSRVEAPERVTWTEENHDTDRLSRSLAAYTLVGLCEITDARAASSVTDGFNDGGIDALYFDRPNNRLVIIQSKFKRTGAAPAQDENLKTVNGIRSLLNRRFTTFNTHFQQRLDEIEEALDTPGISIEVGLTFLGENLGNHVISDLDALRDEVNVLNPCMSWQAHGLTRIYGWLIAEQTPGAVTANVTLENWAFVASPRKAVYGQISAIELAQLVATKDKALFERNIRHYLGSIGVNAAIAETVRRQPEDLFYLNNGLTAVTDAITPAAGTPSRRVFQFTNFSIVNGAQTAGAIATAAESGAISPEARVLITIIQIGGCTDDIGVRITRARNRQNAVRGVDFAALDPNQERLRQELTLAGITYHYRPSADSRVRREDALTLEDAALALACLSFKVLSSAQIQEMENRGQKAQNAVDYVVTAKKQISRLWEQEDELYTTLFPSGLSGARMWRYVLIFRMVDQILADNERAERGREDSYSRRMYYRHGRYFITAVLAHVSHDILSKVDLQLSVEDRTLISQRINELAELIYSQSTILQGSRGYLAVFKNLTDSQPLADRVLAKLEERNRPATQSQAPPAADAR